MSQNDTLAVDIDVNGATGKATSAAGGKAASAAGGKPAPERKCILSGVHGGRDELIRLALDDDGRVHADLAARAPGRGAWLAPDRTLIATAAAKGKLRGALMRAFKTTCVTVPDDLVDQVASGLERRALDRLGLENKAGHLIWGSDRIGDAVGAGRVRLLLHANDAAPDGVAKLDGKARGAPNTVVSCVLPADRARLSVALGRENVVHAAVCDGGAATRVIAAVARWRAFNGSISAQTTATDAVEMKVSGS
jgi:predicted RNA-binding protein YlxR (DUF448 family)